jgi:3-hydroxyacyl-[acyl-carrier-protein] dehydratase
MTEKIIEIDGILKRLPHRYPFLLIDRVIIKDGGKEAIGIKNVTFNEPHFLGHFPDKPIMPGVLIVEAMAQTAGVMFMEFFNSSAESKLVYLMSVDCAKFRKPVVPSDVLELHLSTLQNRSNVWKMSGAAIVKGQKVAECGFSAMVVDKS